MQNARHPSFLRYFPICDHVQNEKLRHLPQSIRVICRKGCGFLAVVVCRYRLDCRHPDRFENSGRIKFFSPGVGILQANTSYKM
jgi:hypothetical protein